VIGAASNPFKLPDGPSATVRRWAYALLWLPILFLLLVVLPSCQAIFDKFDKAGQLPELTIWVMTVVRLNCRAYYAPTLFFVVGLLILDATVVALLRRRRHASVLVHGWFIGICLLSMGVLWLAISRLFLEFKSSGPP
jgi:hypothetical protein